MHTFLTESVFEKCQGLYDLDVSENKQAISVDKLLREIQTSPLTNLTELIAAECSTERKLFQGESTCPPIEERKLDLDGLSTLLRLDIRDCQLLEKHLKMLFESTALKGLVYLNVSKSWWEQETFAKMIETKVLINLEILGLQGMKQDHSFTSKGPR